MHTYNIYSIHIYKVYTYRYCTYLGGEPVCDHQGQRAGAGRDVAPHLGLRPNAHDRELGQLLQGDRESYCDNSS